MFTVFKFCFKIIGENTVDVQNFHRHNNALNRNEDVGSILP
jgi:hypothetical protein